MNILYLAHRIPYPPTKGDKIRSFHQVRYLSERHSVHVVCWVDDPEDRQHVEALKKMCASVTVLHRSAGATKARAVLGLLQSRPLSVSAFWSKKMYRLVEGILNSKKIDRIFVYSSAMAEYVLDTRDASIRRVIDFVDVDSEKWRSYAERSKGPGGWVYRVEAQRLARYEEHLLRTFDHSIITSEREAGLLRRLVPDASTAVISNGVDLEYFNPELFHHSSPSPPALVFTGTMDYLPNVDGVRFFCGEIFPLVREVIPDVVFYIVGRNPTREVKSLSQEPGVVVAGSVPDVRPYLAKSWLAVAPLRIARGVQNKVLEAMAMGLPVVGTSQAFQGAQARDTDGIRQADEPETFAREILALLKNNAVRREASINARRYVERQHRWEDHGAALDRILLGSEML